ncbi:LysR family transcriptional regulator [Oceanospirillum linum]|uniref:LysR family transcriptional regulator n=1 Tax=Oceanospirillum linum TaxID=966 RepID=A0A1T1H870_OCELI|nr:LysR family transcriptional regulator [Oceanospirillum linum]OOV85966.1 LysR family transcriptional regulator [Oceanospirillum linum]SEG44845.1 DNA-binding transcriptional regulator, LysR family [Oleiphilus messinensis]SMP34413.1 DNA-binding transcriptional regulator, LysR family [Oceanospirillum linum]
MRSTFNLRQLEAFRAVIKHGSALRAADSLFLTQSAVSKLISSFEEATGLELFTRQSGRLKPTSDALKLFEQSDHLFAELSGLNRKIGELKNKERRGLTIGFLPALASQYSAEVCRLFRQENPGIELSLVTSNSPAIKELLISHKLDIGVVATPIDHPTISSTPILSSSLMAVLPRDHPLARQKVLHARDLDGFDFVDYNPDDHCSALQTKLFDQFNCRPNFLINGTTASMVINLVTAGFGVGLVHPASAHWRHQQLAIIPFMPKTPISYYFCHNEQNHNADLIQVFAQCMDKIYYDVFRQDTLKDTHL